MIDSCVSANRIKPYVVTGPIYRQKRQTPFVGYEPFYRANGLSTAFISLLIGVVMILP